ncbi:MAG: MmgE/PrpD family protein [Firmicutes bacterium]|nr:MmgE/PrpD family protein [Bacillota bacterium]
MSPESASEFITGLEWDCIPEDVVEHAKMCLLDYLACMRAGSATEATQAARRFASLWFGGPQTSALGGRERMGLLGAVFCNAIAASELDIDDGHRAALGHPGAAIIPAALGVGGMLRSSGKELLASIIVGYEVGVRAGEIIYSQSKERFFGSGTWAAIGVAAASARLLRLSRPQSSAAIGIAEAHAPLTPVMKSIASGAMVKESLGWAAVTGVSAALLAREGFEGVESVLDEAKEPQRWGDEYYIKRVYFKQYPSCRWSHPVLDAITALLRHHPLGADEVQEVRVYTFAKALSLANYRPKTVHHAQYSIPFTVGALLVRGDVTPRDISPESIHDARLLDVARRVRLILDPDREKVFPDKCTARVVIVKRDGAFLESPVIQARGDWDNPFTREEMIGKFLRLTTGALTEHQQRLTLRLVDGLERSELREVVDGEEERQCLGI